MYDRWWEDYLRELNDMAETPKFDDIGDRDRRRKEYEDRQEQIRKDELAVQRGKLEFLLRLDVDKDPPGGNR